MTGALVDVDYASAKHTRVYGHRRKSDESTKVDVGSIGTEYQFKLATRRLRSRHPLRQCKSLPLYSL